MDQNLFRQVIMEHNNKPKNKVNEVPGEDYKVKEALNPSCGDMVVIYVKFEDDKIVDVKFKGEGCHICCASASIMTQELIGLSKEEVLNKVDMFDLLLKDQEFEDDLFEDAIVLSALSKSPARYKCAHLSWDTISKIVKEEK